MNSLLQSCKQLNVFGTQLPRKSGATPYRLGECVWGCVCVVGVVFAMGVGLCVGLCVCMYLCDL